MAVTVTYEHPVAGTTAPTAAQAAAVNSVSATVEATADADTTAVVTHNFGISAGDLARGWPYVVLEPLAAAARLSLWIVSAKATNAVTCSKATTAGSGAAGAQLRVGVMRPFSMTQ